MKFKLKDLIEIIYDMSDFHRLCKRAPLDFDCRIGNCLKCNFITIKKILKNNEPQFNNLKLDYEKMWDEFKKNHFMVAISSKSGNIRKSKSICDEMNNMEREQWEKLNKQKIDLMARNGK